MSGKVRANEHLATGDRWHAYNDPTKWADPGIWHLPSFNLGNYQKKINRILGTADGAPIVRVVWAWHVKRWEAGEMRQAYRFFTATLPNGDTCDLSPPRFMLEERFEPGQYMSSWPLVRYIKGRDVLGDPPPDGFYGYLLTIADHDPEARCCERARKLWKKGKRATFRCWGYYKLPDEKELEILRQARSKRDAAPYKQSPHEPLSAQTLAEIALIERSWNEEQEARRKLKCHEMWSDHVRIWGHRLDTIDPTVLHHGKYKFMPQNRFEETPSGLIVPKE